MIKLLQITGQLCCPFVKTFGILVLKKQRAALKKAFYSLHQLAILAILTDNNQEICNPANSAIV
ncbi:hypothetical protein [Microcystis sp. 0824]|uniref:hypothetical protein n=1 Tax=Microcystis sp. 0824 TaxID=1502726 RepID=UPI0011B21759|nr:hypothetical protein [Microcystis sp. 0824]